jgi:hypothetical protein
VLRAIEADPQIGVRLGELMPEGNFDQSLHPLFTQFPGGNMGPFRNAIAAVSQRIIGDADFVLYQGDIERYVADLRPLLHDEEEFKSTRQRNVQFEEAKLVITLRKSMGALPGRRLVPPKRQFHTRTNFEPGKPLFGTGVEVIQGLFRAQNSRTDKEEKDRLARIESAFEEVTQGVRYAIELNDGVLTVHFSFKGGPLVPAAECGLGLQDLLVILYNAIFDQAPILLVEEPENHLHPVWQRALARFIKRDVDKYVIFATHSSTFLDTSLADRVFLTRYGPDGIAVETVDQKVNVLRELGYAKSDFVSASVLALVEGPGDQDVIEHYLGTQFPETTGRVAFQFIGGDNGKHVRLSHLVEAFEYVVAFADSEIDQGSGRTRRAFKSLCEKHEVPCQLSALPNLEFYFPITAYRRVFPSGNFPNDWKTSAPVTSQTTARVKEKTLELAQATAWSEIWDTDLGAFIARIAALART